MSNVTVPNFATTGTDLRKGLWQLSRALKAAGWITKASSDGTTKDTTGTYANDKWNGTAGTGGSGAAASITSISGAQVTLTGLTGFASGTAGQRWITITGASNSANNGTFKILTFISATSVTIFNPLGVAPDGNNGAISWTENIPLSDTYANPGGNSASGWIVMQGPSTIKIAANSFSAGTTVVNTAGNNQTGSTAKYSATAGLAFNNLPVITGLTNMSYASVGRVLTISGAANSANNGTFVIVDYISSTSVVISNLTPNYNDANNGSLTWTEKLSVPFIRGENVTQTTTGAQGEIIGQQFDFTTGSGYLVIQPRFYGTGSVLGWDGYDIITGATSGASITPAGSTPIEFVREMVIWAGSAASNTHTGYMQCVDGYSESTSRFSSLAGSTGCTATIAPGGGGTNNSFPVPGSYVWAGTGGSKADAKTYLTTTAGTYTNVQIMCADATYYSGKSADGSFIVAVGISTSTGSFLGYGYYRLDDHEDGDVDPYVFYAPSNDLAYVPTRTTLTNAYSVTGEQFALTGTITTNQSCLSYNNTFRGWRRRGFNDTFDSFQNYMPGILCTGAAYPSGGATNGSGTSLLFQNTADAESVATAQDTFNTGTASAVFVGEPIWVISTQANQRTYKGTCRWWRANPINPSSVSPPDTFGSKSWLVLCTNVNSIVTMGGPWDGATTPTH